MLRARGISCGGAGRSGLGERLVEAGDERAAEELEVLLVAGQRRRHRDRGAAAGARIAPLRAATAASRARRAPGSSSSIAPSRPMPARTSATRGMVGQRLAARRRARPPSPRRGRAVRPLEDVEVGQRGGAARGVAGVGRPWRNTRNRARPERRGHAPVDDHAAERQVAAGHALGEDDHVGHDVPALDAEPGAEAAEAADHRVDDEQHAVRAAELGDALEVALRRREHAAGADDRLDEERGDMARRRSARSPVERLQRVVRDTETCACSGPQPSRLPGIPARLVPNPCVPW